MLRGRAQPERAVRARPTSIPARYGVIVEAGFRRGVLLPALTGVDTVDAQVGIALQKAGIAADEAVRRAAVRGRDPIPRRRRARPYLRAATTAAGDAGRMTEAPPVVALFGATALGKSDVARRARRRLDADIVVADSMQVYEGLPIVTNQPGARRGRARATTVGLGPRRMTSPWPSTPAWPTRSSTTCLPPAARWSSRAAPGCTSEPPSATSSSRRRRTRERRAALRALGARPGGAGRRARRAAPDAGARRPAQRAPRHPRPGGALHAGRPPGRTADGASSGRPAAALRAPARRARAGRRP